MQPSKAYIIRVEGHAESEEKAAHCAESCDKAGQEWEYWEAYNAIMECLKVTDHYMTRGEVACALSHISLWAKCVIEDQPLIVLEHDAVMVEKYEHHAVYNSICYLGGHEQVKQGWKVLPTPPHASEGPNYHFICRAHAYAIDPAVAKNMLAHVLKMGICGPLDILLRADIFPIHQMGLYAYNEWDGDKMNTTIKGRPLEGRSTERNDDLSV
jgi:hypothetical protein